MCGRIGMAHPNEIVGRFGLGAQQLSFDARYNAAPTQLMPVVVKDGPRVARMMRWGYEPAWLKEMGARRPLINARSEKLASAPTFREVFLFRRAIVPSSHFFEWAICGRDKVPYLFRLKGGELFGLAGLWFGEGNERRFVIITTDPNEVTRPVHNRMPAILRREDEELWLDPGRVEPEQLMALLSPYPSSEMEAYPVSTRVNSPANDSSDLLRCIA